MQLYQDCVFKQCFANKNNDRIFFELEYIENDRLHSVITSIRSNNVANDLAKYRKEFNCYDKCNAELDITFDKFNTFVNLLAIKKI